MIEAENAMNALFTKFLIIVFILGVAQKNQTQCQLHYSKKKKRSGFPEIKIKKKAVLKERRSQQNLNQF
jgi:hypothetical protein